VSLGVGVCGDRVAGRADRAAAFVPEHDDERRMQVLDGVLDAAQRVVINHVAGLAHDEEVAQTLVEQDLGPGARVGAAEDDGHGVL
jgi:hypothetical protein